MQLNWRFTGDKSRVRGTVLATAIYGPFSRFIICECRTREPGVYVYRVGDATRRTDAQVREGKTPLAYWRGTFATLEAALAACDAEAALDVPALQAWRDYCAGRAA
jgi:hypothetical protein